MNWLRIALLSSAIIFIIFGVCGFILALSQTGLSYPRFAEIFIGIAGTQSGLVLIHAIKSEKNG